MEPRFTLRQVRYFLAAARAGSVTQAAHDIHISAPSISAAINQIESQFGIQLFVRHHSEGLLLTQEGRAFFAEAKKFYEHAEQLDDTARGLGKTVSGVIYASCFITLAPLLIPRLLKAFASTYPDARLSFTEGNQGSLFTALRDGLVQVAFGYSMGIASGLVFEPFGEVRPYCILPRDHPLAGNSDVSLEALRSEPFIMFDLPKSREYYMSLFQKAAVVPNIAYRTTLIEVVCAMVGHGLGYSILYVPRLNPVSVDGAAFAVLPLAGELPRLSVGLISSAETAASHIYEAVRTVSHDAIRGLLAFNEPSSAR